MWCGSIRRITLAFISSLNKKRSIENTKLLFIKCIILLLNTMRLEENCVLFSTEDSITKDIL